MKKIPPKLRGPLISAVVLLVGLGAIISVATQTHLFGFNHGGYTPTTTVGLLTPTDTVNPSINPVHTGSGVTYTATLTGTGAIPTGTVTFKDGGSAISTCGASGVVTLTSGAATCTVTYGSTAGSPHSITAPYSGNASYVAVASNTVSETVSSGGGTAGLGTGPSLAVCSGTCGSYVSPALTGGIDSVGTCSTYNWSGAVTMANSTTFGPTVSGSSERCPFNGVMSTDGSTTEANAYFFIEIPSGLQINNTAHPVPVVFVWPDACTVSGQTPGCWNIVKNSNGSLTDPGPPTWEDWYLNHGGPPAVLVMMTALTSGGYETGYLYGKTFNCAGCDQSFEAAGALRFLKDRMAVNPNQVFATGGSKGGFMSEDVMCSPQTQATFTGVGVGSAHLDTGTNGYSSYPLAPLPPPEPFGTGGCPALVSTTSQAARLPQPKNTAVPVMDQIWMSPTDGSYACTNTQGIDGVAGQAASGAPRGWCLNGGGVVSNGSAAYGPDYMETQVTGAAFGCSSTPTGGTATDATYGAVSVKVRTYEGCNTNAGGTVNGTVTPFIGATQVVDFVGNGCHAFGCNPQTNALTGSTSFDLASQEWDFWMTGAAS